MTEYNIELATGTITLRINTGGWGDAIFRIVSNGGNYPVADDYEMRIAVNDDANLVDKIFWWEGGVKTRIYRHNPLDVHDDYASLSGSVLTIHGKQIIGDVGDISNQFRFSFGNTIFPGYEAFQSGFLQYFQVVDKTNETVYNLIFDGSSLTAEVDDSANDAEGDNDDVDAAIGAASGDPFIIPCLRS